MLPADEESASEVMVWIESITTASGLFSQTARIMLSQELHDEMKRFSAFTPSRFALSES